MWPSPGEPAAKTSGFSTGDAAFAHAPGPAPASSWPALRPAELQSFLLGVVRRTHGFDLVPFEDDDADLSTLRDVMQACVQVAIEALGLVIDRYDRDAGDDDDDTSDPRVQQLVDVAFMGRMGLTERRRVLGAAAPDDRWALLETASIASREILMSLSAVEALLTAIEGLRADNSFYKIERERALRARYAFFCFRQDVPTAAPAPVLSEVARHVRYAALGIAGSPATTCTRICASATGSRSAGCNSDCSVGCATRVPPPPTATKASGSGTTRPRSRTFCSASTNARNSASTTCARCDKPSTGCRKSTC